MPRFIALPVGQGDAFYLEREGLSVLIDGGRSRTALPSVFQATTRRHGVDVIVCTHNDADHAGGILGFLESGLGCKEVWLPGRWLRALPDLLRPFVEVFVELADNIAESDFVANMEGPQSSPELLEAYSERIHDDRAEDSPPGDSLSIPEHGWPESYLEMLEQAEPWGDPSYWPGPWPLETWLSWVYLPSPRLGPAGVLLLCSAINAAARIREIATQAFHRGIPVRWFEFDISKPSGGVPALQPVNAREIARVSPRVGPLLQWLALTVSNQESLVFWSPTTEQHPGVLFTADSDLANAGMPSQLSSAIVTAPHHGSEANANAYSAVAKATNDHLLVTWVSVHQNDY